MPSDKSVAELSRGWDETAHIINLLSLKKALIKSYQRKDQSKDSPYRPAPWRHKVLFILTPTEKHFGIKFFFTQNWNFPQLPTGHETENQWKRRGRPRKCDRKILYYVLQMASFMANSADGGSQSVAASWQNLCKTVNRRFIEKTDLLHRLKWRGFFC